MRALPLALTIAALFGAAQACRPTQLESGTNHDGLSVATQGGQVNGFIDPSTPGVRRFLQIPYAQPPIGELRFAPPEPALPFGEIHATEFGPSCMQFLAKTPPTIYTQFINQFNVQGLNVSSQDVSEDCLTLSVWAPACPKVAAPLPVLVFLFGGGFMMGGQNVPYQIPAKWVQRTQGHVIVTLNYRLNIFGFPDAAGLSQDKQNLGLLDQRLAVEWVRDNIAAFGGDPEHITLWGQSAGAVAAGYYQYAYQEDPIVTAIIQDSGSEMLAAGDLSSSDTTHSNFSTVAAAVGCGDLSPDQELACMRSDNVSALAIEEAIQANNRAGNKHLIIFTPIVDNKTVFANYTARSEARQVATIPAIIGTTANDGAAFIPLMMDHHINETLAAGATLAFFFCPAHLGATNRILAGVPVYRFLYAGNFSNISPMPFLGAYHEAELPMLFGTDEDFRGPSTPLQKMTSRVMQDEWVAFARAGVQGMEQVGWPRYTSTEGQGSMVREFGGMGTAVRDVQLAEMNGLCADLNKSVDKEAGKST
ncbi:Alpha/Beta hydrolase protein [Cercophora newfieldiana]|uniref:Carboxylic ester hydrolase n=1 Tax=Cercophora newfieldiana TaxID=92897 RepID=A0AA40CNE3_9PEZI|nr:Alpha/Beta hydrolase protein [Cercophora newfieldiana]